MASQGPSGTLPGTRQEGEIGLLFALGAFQGRIWSQNGTPNGTQNHSKIDLGAQGPPKSAQEPPGGPKRPPRAPPQEAPGGPNSRPSEAHKHTKKLFEKIGQKVFRNSFTQDPPKVLGSVAGIGGAAPLEIRPFRLKEGPWSEANLGCIGNRVPKETQCLPKVNSPKSPPAGSHPPTAGQSSPPELPA